MVIDLLSDRIDVAIRAGPLKSSSLVPKKLGETALTIVAAPFYLERCGTPRTIADLDKHNCLGFGYTRSTNGWLLLESGQSTVVPPTGRVQASDGEALRHLARSGVGLARLAHFTVQEDIGAGRLVPVLDHLNPGDREEFHAVYVGQQGPMPSRVRVLLDFLAEYCRIP